MQKVLIVDDSFGVRRLIQEVLLEEGFAAEVTADGEQALELAKNKDFQLIILDVKLPDQSGIDVLKKLHEEGSGAGVIMMTAYEELSSLPRIGDWGLVASFSKPFDIHDVRESVKRLLMHGP